MTDKTTATEAKPDEKPAESTTEAAADPAALWAELGFDAPTPPAEGRAQEQAEEKVETAEPKAGEQPAEGAKPEGETPKEQDIWANATPEQKAYIERLQQSERSAAGRISALWKRYPEIFTDKGEVAERSATTVVPQRREREAPKQTKKPPVITDDPDVKKLQDEWPEVGGPMVKIFTDLSKQNEGLQAELNRLSSKEQKEQLARNEQLLAEKHSDWMEVAASDEFTAWLNAQPQLVKDAAQRNGNAIVNLEEAAYLFDSFKLVHGKAAAPTSAAPPDKGASPNGTLSDKRKAQLESSQTPTTKGKPKAAPGIPDDPKLAWEAYQRMGAF